MKTLLVVCGATASGKTSLAIQLAKQLHTEILSADSRQFFREMTIGTAKPSPQELAEVPHHFINSLSIHEDYSAGDFEKDALNLLDTLFQKHEVVLLVGGSGLYINAVCEGFDQLPKASDELRTELNNRLANQGIESLLAELKQVDETYAQQVDTANPQRIIRALEVYHTSGKPFSSFHEKKKNKRPFTIRKLAIDWDREVLYSRINTRVEQMLEEGLEEEARNLYAYRQVNALQTVGYTEFFDYFDGKISREEAIRLIKRNSRRYAKRQLTWFRRDKTIEWIQGENIHKITPFQFFNNL